MRNSLPLALGTTSSLNTIPLEEKVTIASLSIISSALMFVSRRSASPERLITSPLRIISSGTSTTSDLSILILLDELSPFTILICLSEISNDSICPFTSINYFITVRSPHSHRLPAKVPCDGVCKHYWFSSPSSEP